MQAEFAALYVPPNIDPQLLALWIEREQIAIERSQRKAPPPPPREQGRNLVRLFPAYIGIAVMCFAILLGLIQNHETTVILQTACIAFLVYTFIGIFVGVIAERCVNDSVETLLRDIIKRGKQAGQDSETTTAP
jgi:hypothetical protein